MQKIFLIHGIVHADCTPPQQLFERRRRFHLYYFQMYFIFSRRFSVDPLQAHGETNLVGGRIVSATSTKRFVIFYLQHKTRHFDLLADNRFAHSFSPQPLKRDVVTLGCRSCSIDVNILPLMNSLNASIDLPAPSLDSGRWVTPPSRMASTCLHL